MNLRTCASRLAPAWRGAIVFAMSCLFIGFFVPFARAVTITGSTYASDTGDPSFPTPQSKSFNIGNPTSASSSIRSDVTAAHAQALASASIASGTLVKSTSGRAWLDTTTPPSLFNNRGDLWNASASGTQLILHGPAGGSAPFTFFIPGLTKDTSIPFPSDSVGDPATMHPAQAGQQGFFSNNGTTGSPTTLPVFMDEYLHVDASIRIGATVFYSFQGDLIYHPGDNTITGANGFTTLAQGATKTTISNGTGPVFSLRLDDFSQQSLDIPVDTPFDAIINMSMSQGDPTFGFNGGNNGSPPPSNFPTGLPAGFVTSGLPNNVGPIGAGGSFAAEFIMNTPGYSLEVVPEPSSLVMAGIGLAAALGLRRRMRTR